MKKLALFLFFGALPAIAMEKPTHQREINNIIFLEPYFDSSKKEYVIEATNQDKQKIGFLAFFPSHGTHWQMKALYVDHDYRRQGIAQRLLQECINKIKELNANELSWQIYRYWHERRSIDCYLF